MNETLKTIASRRSIRKYKVEQIPEPELQEILNAAIYAPSAVNQQKWHFTVIQNKDILDRMVNIIKEGIISSGNGFLGRAASDPSYNTFYNAPTVILISADEKALVPQIDCGLAAENIVLAAESLGIGSCIITSSHFLFASPKADEMKKELGIPDGYSFMCTIALGYKDGESPAAPPKNKDVVNYVR